MELYSPKYEPKLRILKLGGQSTRRIHLQQLNYQMGRKMTDELR